MSDAVDVPTTNSDQVDPDTYSATEWRRDMLKSSAATLFMTQLSSLPSDSPARPWMERALTEGGFEVVVSFPEGITAPERFDVNSTDSHPRESSAAVTIRPID